jgi:hypothetical protein
MTYSKHLSVNGVQNDVDREPAFWKCCMVWLMFLYSSAVLPHDLFCGFAFWGHFNLSEGLGSPHVHLLSANAHAYWKGGGPPSTAGWREAPLISHPALPRSKVWKGGRKHKSSCRP